MYRMSMGKPNVDKRQHWTAEGRSKKALTRAQAKQLTKRYPYMDKYKCGICGEWHIGHSLRESKRKKDPNYEEYQKKLQDKKLQKQAAKRIRQQEKAMEKKMGRIIRLSDSGKCQRMRVMQSINHLHGRQFKEDKPSEELQRLFRLGNMVETMEIRHLVKTRFAHIPDEDILRQYKLRMGPYGFGHPDLIILERSKKVAWLWEIKSSQQAAPEHFLQLKSYAHWLARDPDFQGWEILPRLLIAPRHGGLPIEYPVECSEWDIEGIHAEADAVIAKAQRQEIPHRTCMTPREGDSKFCPLVTECFKNWTPSNTTEITDSDIILVVERLADLYELRDQYGPIDLLVKEVDQIEDSLEQILEPKCTYEAGDCFVRYTVSESQSKSYALAVKAGIDPRDEDAMKAFSKPSKRRKFTVSRGV